MVALASALYLLSEFFRLRNKSSPLAKLTLAAAREEEMGSFVLKPLYYALGIALALVVFPENIGDSAIVVLTIGDGLAALFGAAIGRTPIPYNVSKTIEGSLIGFASAFLAACLFVSVPIALLGAITGGLVESRDRLIDDNLSVPLISGCAMWVMILVGR
jgi:dolichol kinase